MNQEKIETGVAIAGSTHVSVYFSSSRTYYKAVIPLEQAVLLKQQLEEVIKMQDQL